MRRYSSAEKVMDAWYPDQSRSQERFHEFLKAGFDWETGDQVAQRARSRGDSEGDTYFRRIGGDAVTEGPGNIGAGVTYEADGTVADDQQKAVAEDVDSDMGAKLAGLFIDDPADKAKAMARARDEYEQRMYEENKEKASKDEPFPTEAVRSLKLDLSKPNGMPAGYYKSEGAMAAGGSNVTASDSGAFNPRYSSKEFDEFVSTPMSSPRDYGASITHPQSPDTQSD